MRRCVPWIHAMAVATIACGFAFDASAQVVDMTRGRLDRCELHRSLGRQLPPECGGTGPAARELTRGRVVIGGGSQPQAKTDGGPPVAAAGRPVRPQVIDRPAPTRDKPYGVALLVPFDFDSDHLTAAGKRAVDTLADVLKLNGQDKFIIQGHTDARGSEPYNKDLSLRRAETVAAYLVEKHGIPRDRLETQGLGESKLLLPSDPNNGRNRRVQVFNVGG